MAFGQISSMSSSLIDEVTQAMFDINASGGKGFSLQSYSKDYQQHLRNQAAAAIEICRNRKDDL